MIRLLRLAAIACLALMLPLAAHAEQQDVAAISRGVVRVVIIATDGKDAYFVGHGSGFAVAPDKVLTNAHVVELLRTEKNLVVGIIPSEGKRSYGGKVIAFSPGNDLALIQLKEGSLPVATFFSGGPADGQHVTAIGYPASVDRAQGLDLSELIKPLSPVKTSGTVSTGRSSHGFDTLLHTAPMAQGNSGGPLVDDCGRVLGVNSFGSQAESEADAEFGFAVSNREVASFLRQAGVQFQRTAVPCRTIAELDAEEAKRRQEQLARQEQQELSAQIAQERARMKAREAAEREVYSSRENAMAIAGLLMLLGGLALGAAMMFNAEHKRRERMWAAIAGCVMLLGATLAFILRPSFSEIDEQASLPPDQNASGSAPETPKGGSYMCRIDESRSRITISDIASVALSWAPGGCVNGNTQYGQNGESWSRILVPNSEASISVNSFDPATSTYRVERFLPDADILDHARELRGHFTFNGCTSDPENLAKLSQMQSEIAAILPSQPNERLIYDCSPEHETKPEAKAGE